MAQIDMPEKALNSLVGDMVGQSSVMAETAEKIAAKARQKAAGHGSLSGKIEVETAGRGKDRLITLDDGPKTIAIEYGHVHNRNPARWVPGLHIMRNTYLAL